MEWKGHLDNLPSSSVSSDTEAGYQPLYITNINNIGNVSAIKLGKFFILPD